MTAALYIGGGFILIVIGAVTYYLTSKKGDKKE
jgi:hypothetical protein